MEDELMKRIDALLDVHPRDPQMIRQSAAALQRRLRDVCSDLGLIDLDPTVHVLDRVGFEVAVEFAHLGRRRTDIVLRRLEDLAKQQRAPHQINQATSLFR